MLELLRRSPFCAGAALHDEEHNERRPVHGAIAHDARPPRGQPLSIHLPAGDAIPGVLCPRLFRHPFLQHRRSHGLKSHSKQYSGRQGNLERAEFKSPSIHRYTSGILSRHQAIQQQLLSMSPLPQINSAKVLAFRLPQSGTQVGVHIGPAALWPELCSVRGFCCM